MTTTISSRRVVVVSFLVDLLDVITNLVVAILTGSAVIFGEMAQGIADSIGSGLLVVGERRALVAALLMLIGSIVLIAQARALITGRALPASMLAQLQQSVLCDPRVHSVNRLAAIYAGASQILIEADLDLAGSLATRQIETLLDELEDRLRTILPDTERVRVQLNSMAGQL